MASGPRTILFVLVVVLGLVTLFQSQSDRVEVLVVTHPVPAGQVIDAGRSSARRRLPASTGRSPPPTSTRSWESAPPAGLVEGQVLTESAVSEEQVPADGERLVAIRLDEGRVPGGLTPGDLVDVLATPPDGDPGTKEQLEAPRVLAEAARVDSVGQYARRARWS